MYPDKLEVEYRPAWWKNILYIPFATAAIILGIIIMFPFSGYVLPILGAFAEICIVCLALFFIHIAEKCNPILTRKYLFQLFSLSIRIRCFWGGLLFFSGWSVVFYIDPIVVISGFIGVLISCVILRYVFVYWGIIEQGRIGKCWLSGMVVGFVLLLLNMFSCIAS